MKISNLKKLAVVQMTSTTDPSLNFSKIETFTSQASKQGAEMIFLPENFNFLGKLGEGLSHAQPLTGSYMSKYKSLSKSNKIWMSLGGFQELSKNPTKYYNSQIILNDSGEIISVYRKMYLFDVKIDEDIIMHESKYCLAGEKISEVVPTPIGKLGMGICYDLRFPELFRTLSVGGAEVLSIPAAFMEKTGYAHWEVLIRARAIENGAFVVASAQDGRHEAGRVSFGHSSVIDPWGIQVSVSSSGERVNLVDIDLELVSSSRKRLPVLSHYKLL
jgi:predicted amidohydrolase